MQLVVSLAHHSLSKLLKQDRFSWLEEKTSTSLLFLLLTHVLSRPRLTPAPELLLYIILVLELHTAGAAYSWLLLIKLIFIYIFFFSPHGAQSQGQLRRSNSPIRSVSVNPRLFCTEKCCIYAALWKKGGPGGRLHCSRRLVFGWLKGNKRYSQGKVDLQATGNSGAKRSWNLDFCVCLPPPPHPPMVFSVSWRESWTPKCCRGKGKT